MSLDGGVCVVMGSPCRPAVGCCAAWMASGSSCPRSGLYTESPALTRYVVSIKNIDCDIKLAGWLLGSLASSRPLNECKCLMWLNHSSFTKTYHCQQATSMHIQGKAVVTPAPEGRGWGCHKLTSCIRLSSEMHVVMKMPDKRQTYGCSPPREAGRTVVNCPEMSLSATMEDGVAFCAIQIFTSGKFKLYALRLGQQSALFGPCASFVTPPD